MKRVLPFTVLCLVLVSLAVFSPKSARASGGFVNNLWGVAAVNRDDVWAVGEANASTHSQALIEHLHDHAWQIVPSPNPSGEIAASLYGVAARSSHDVWAVGNFARLNETSQTLIEHWNGTQWQIITSPNLSGSNGLASVAVISEHNAWAVGTLIEHWNGQTWQIVPGPSNAPSSVSLTSVTYTSKNDVWAVGNYSDSNNVGYGIIEHWNGHVWSLITNPTPVNGTLQSVAAISARDVWAVGYSHASNGIESTLTEHWNGHIWQIVASSDPTHNSLLRLTGVSAVAHNDVWAVGFVRNASGIENTLTEHWNGRTWQIVVSATDSASSELEAVVAVSDESVWAVGGIFPASSSLPLTEYWNGWFWGIVSSPTP